MVLVTNANFICYSISFRKKINALLKLQDVRNNKCPLSVLFFFLFIEEEEEVFDVIVLSIREIRKPEKQK